MVIITLTSNIQNRDQDCGNECHWVVNESGPCKIKEKSTDCFRWNPNIVIEGGQLGAC